MHWERMRVFSLQEYYREYLVGRQNYQDKSQDFRAKKKVSGSEIILSRIQIVELTNC